MKFIFASILFISASCFISCEKPEPLYQAPIISAGTVTQQLEMGSSYGTQVYFDFETGTFASNSPYTWDIAFSSSAENKIIINGGKNGVFSACSLGKISFSDPVDPSTIEKDEWKHDNPSGNIDSSALGHSLNRKISGNYWEGDSCMYLIKLGEEKDLGDKTFVKLRVINRNGANYLIEWSYWKDQMPKHSFIPTYEEKNFTYFCFDCSQGILNEPIDKDEWDILFTRYKEEIYYAQVNQTEGYTVTGVLSNPANTKTMNLTNVIEYDDIDLNYAKGIVFNNHLNNIGYDWKNFSIQANKYTINPKNAYIIKSRRGLFYKMKFVDFYNDKDETGYPKMAYQLLQ